MLTTGPSGNSQDVAPVEDKFPANIRKNRDKKQEVVSFISFASTGSLEMLRSYFRGRTSLTNRLSTGTFCGQLCHCI